MNIFFAKDAARHLDLRAGGPAKKLDIELGGNRSRTPDLPPHTKSFEVAVAEDEINLASG